MNMLGSGFGTLLPLGDIEAASVCISCLRKSSYDFGISSEALMFARWIRIYPSSVNSGATPFPLAAELVSNTRANIFSSNFF